MKALIVANEFLESEVCELMRAVSHAYAREEGSRLTPADSTWSQAMADLTYFVALPFIATDDGIAAGVYKQRPQRLIRSRIRVGVADPGVPMSLDVTLAEYSSIKDWSTRKVAASVVCRARLRQVSTLS